MIEPNGGHGNPKKGLFGPQLLAVEKRDRTRHPKLNTGLSLTSVLEVDIHKPKDFFKTWKPKHCYSAIFKEGIFRRLCSKPCFCVAYFYILVYPGIDNERNRLFHDTRGYIQVVIQLSNNLSCICLILNLWNVKNSEEMPTTISQSKATFSNCLLCRWTNV